MLKTELIPLLKERLQLPLPGKEAQYKLGTAARMPFKKQSIPENTKIAGVLCLLYPQNGQWYLPLIQRVVTKRDKHSGQISFPGGKSELTDESHEATALREAQEEIGIIQEDVKILGSLTPLYIPASNFKVYPFVGVIDYIPTFIAQETEVAEVVEVNLEKLIAPETLKYKSMQYSKSFTVKDVPYFDVSNKTVWGATAMMLNEFIEVINQSIEIRA